ncbi:MAG: hypothetical protein V1835_07295 [Candidatus Micrarchaeota archaeon]
MAVAFDRIITYFEGKRGLPVFLLFFFGTLIAVAASQFGALGQAITILAVWAITAFVLGPLEKEKIIGAKTKGGEVFFFMFIGSFFLMLSFGFRLPGLSDILLGFSLGMFSEGIRRYLKPA